MSFTVLHYACSPLLRKKSCFQGYTVTSHCDLSINILTQSLTQYLTSLKRKKEEINGGLIICLCFVRNNFKIEDLDKAVIHLYPLF